MLLLIVKCSLQCATEIINLIDWKCSDFTGDQCFHFHIGKWRHHYIPSQLRLHVHGAQKVLSNICFRMANCFCCLSQNAMMWLAHCRQELQQKSWKTARLFLQDRDQDQNQMFKTKTKTKSSWSKTKTFISVLEAPRDQDHGLEDYNTGHFHNVGFSTMICPRCAPELGGGAQRKFGGHAKKNFPACAPQLQHRVGAYGRYDHVLAASTGGMSPEPPLRLSEQELLEYQPVPRFSGFAV